MLRDAMYVFFILFIVGVIAFVFGGAIANKNEKVECRKWQEQASMYEGFYLVQWQADQCAAHNIIVNAPVK